MDNKIFNINKEEFNDNYSKCVPNRSGKLICSEPEEDRQPVTNSCLSEVKKYGDENIKMTNNTVKQCIYKFFEDTDKTGLKNLNVKPDNKLPENSELKSCDNIINAINTIGNYCHSTNVDILPETQNDILTEDNENNGNGKECTSAILKNKIKTTNLDKHEFTTRFQFNPMGYNNKLGCNQMIKLKEYCNNNNNNKLKDYYNDFVEGKGFLLDENTDLDPNKYSGIDKALVELANEEEKNERKQKIINLSKIFKSGMCNLAKDNIDDEVLNVQFKEWWFQYILGVGFQRNIYIISLFTCLYFKYKILNNNNKYLGIICCVITLLLLYILISNNNFDSIKYFTQMLGYGLPLIITIATLIRLYNMKSYISKSFTGLVIIIIIMLLFYTFIYSFNRGMSKFYNFLIFIFLMFLLLYTTLRQSNIVPNYYIILFVLILMIGLYFIKVMQINMNSVEGKIWNIGGFYILFIIILVFILTLNSNISRNTNKIFSSYLNSTTLDSKNPLSKIILIIYNIIAVGGDTILTFLSPQFALALLVLFRLVNGQWYEPLNSVYSVISGYYMNKTGNKPSTNSYIL